RPGSSQVRARSRCCTKSPSPSRRSTSPNGATSNAPHAPHLAAARVGTPGWFRAVCDDGRESRHVVPRDAGRAQPAAARAQGRADRVRPRLPRGDLRDVRHGGERAAAGPAARALAAAGCLACRAGGPACPNASARLFVAAKVSHLGLLPQGQPERDARVVDMVARMDAEGFGACTNHGECMAACPKEISIDFIAQLNRDYWKAVLSRTPQAARANGGDA